VTVPPRWQPQVVLEAPRRRFRIQLGADELRVQTGTTSNATGGRPRAVFDLRWRDSRPVDFLSPLSIATIDGPLGATNERLVFTGIVEEATVDGDVLHVAGHGAHELAERTIGRLTSSVSVPELVHLMARSAGLGDDRLNIEGIDDLPQEVVQVVVPVDGVRLPTLSVGDDVHFTADARVRAAFAGLGDDDAPVYAVTYVEATRLYDAEERGLAAISAAVDLLLATCAYGLSSRPGGAPLPFSRTRARARPTLRPTVHVQGVSSRRRWCRDRTSFTTAAGADVVALLASWPELARPASTAVADGLAALRRATDAVAGPVERVQALWNALEFYAAGARVHKLLPRPARQELLAAVAATSLTEEQKSRARHVLNELNTPPLLLRLKARVAQDGVPVTLAEMDLLVQLRRRRNDSAHGRSAAAVTAEQLDWAVSVAARLFLFRHVSESG